MKMKVAVITPTIGTKYLNKCIESVDNQTYQDLTHYVFMDGIQYWKEVDEIIEGSEKVRVIKIEENGKIYNCVNSFLVTENLQVYRKAKGFNGDYKYNYREDHASIEGHQRVANMVINHIKKLENNKFTKTLM